MEFKNIKFKVGLPVIVKLLKDEPEEKKGKYGMFQEYTAEYEGEEYHFIAAEGLHNSLLAYKKDDIVEIIKVDGDDDKTYFEVTKLSEEDIKSAEQPPPKLEIAGPNWDKINTDKQHSIVLQVSMKLAVQSYPEKAKLTDNDYEEIEIRMVKFNAIMEKYLGGVAMKEPVKPKFSPLVQAKWDEFDKYLEENKAISKDSYRKFRDWLDSLKDPTTKVLTEQLAKLKESLEPKVSGEYKSYHESLITNYCETLKTKDRLPVIQTLNNMVKKWGIDGLTKLSETSENQCLNLLEEFDKQQISEDNQNLPY